MCVATTVFFTLIEKQSSTLRHSPFCTYNPLIPALTQMPAKAIKSAALILFNSHTNSTNPQHSNPPLHPLHFAHYLYFAPPPPCPQLFIRLCVSHRILNPIATIEHFVNQSPRPAATRSPTFRHFALFSPRTPV